MEKFTYTIKDRDGVHARPAGAILKAISGYSSKIKLIYKDKNIDLKSGGIFALLGLGIRFQDEVYIHATGDDEKEAIIAVKRAFEEFL
ncbi:MAG: HPr family phosphocarrier protein [Aeromonadales bacterium]|nr:HPr family phosphocarrier protein [Aeromonadales bacterium]